MFNSDKKVSPCPTHVPKLATRNASLSVIVFVQSIKVMLLFNSLCENTSINTFASLTAVVNNAFCSIHDGNAFVQIPL
jgi:hypothetical protein